LGHQLAPEPVRTTEFAPALPSQPEHTPPASPPASGHAPPATATSWKAGRFTGTDFPLQPDGTLRCPAGSALLPHEHRRARRWQPAHGLWCQHSQLPSVSVARAVQSASGSATAKPRQVSVLLHPLPVGAAPMRLRGIGADETFGGPVCVCTANTCRSRWSQPLRPPQPFLLRQSLGLSVRIPACPGTAGWLVTPELKRLSGSSSPSSGFQTAWRPSSGWPPSHALSA
jgi:hypothetical protein